MFNYRTHKTQVKVVYRSTSPEIVKIMAEKANPNLGGIYTDPFHSPTTASANLYNLPKPWMGGLRLVGRSSPSNPNFTCIGSDDGVHFWTLTGKYTSPDEGKISMDFTPKAPGVGLLQCGYAKGAIHFYEDDGATIGNTWSRLTCTADFKLEKQTKHTAFNDISGLYVDPEIFNQTANGFAGIRVVSDRLGKFVRDEICVVGTDDGIEWWQISGGSFSDKLKGDFRIGSYEGVCHNGTLRMASGKEWVKMVPTMDMHSLPKEESS